MATTSFYTINGKKKKYSLKKQSSWEDTDEEIIISFFT